MILREVLLTLVAAGILIPTSTFFFLRLLIIVINNQSNDHCSYREACNTHDYVNWYQTLESLHSKGGRMIELQGNVVKVLAAPRHPWETYTSLFQFFFIISSPHRPKLKRREKKSIISFDGSHFFLRSNHPNVRGGLVYKIIIDGFGREPKSVEIYLWDRPKWPRVSLLASYIRSIIITWGLFTKGALDTFSFCSSRHVVQQQQTTVLPFFLEKSDRVEWLVTFRINWMGRLYEYIKKDIII